jgi:hypothetical protein
MEIIIGLAIVVVGVIWYFNAQRKKPEANNDALAPYKVEPPKATVNAADLAGAEIKPVVVETAPIVQPAPVAEDKPTKKPRAPRVGEKAAKTAKAADKAAKKAPAKKRAPAKKKTA